MTAARLAAGAALTAVGSGMRDHGLDLLAVECAELEPSAIRHARATVSRPHRLAVVEGPNERMSA